VDIFSIVKKKLKRKVVFSIAIKEYSLSRDSARQLSPSFRVREFGCKGSDIVLIDDELVVLLQCIREHFGKPVHITSGYRTAAHNAAVGGSKSSQHLLGQAADFSVEGVDVATVAAYAKTLLPSRGGIGRYPKDAAHPQRRTGWVHIDTRAGKSRWRGWDQWRASCPPSSPGR
jgi:uncharacterized protein YcbK (DUF882 family)